MPDKANHEVMYLYMKDVQPITLPYPNPIRLKRRQNSMRVPSPKSLQVNFKRPLFIKSGEPDSAN
jgi:hypothetical protein